MPAEDRADPSGLDATRLDDVAARLLRSSAAALEGSHELLAHYPDTGDAATQRAVDSLIERAAAALGALTDALARTSRGLAAAARAITPPSGESAPGVAGFRPDPLV